MPTLIRIVLAAASCCVATGVFGQQTPDFAATKLKDEVRTPWQRSGLAIAEELGGHRRVRRVVRRQGRRDPAKSVKVVWNGAARATTLQKGELRLTSPDYNPAKLHKNERLPGGTYDFSVTPFAVVIGTRSRNEDMVALCREKAQSFIDRWRSWQKQEPRVFLDTEIADADIKRYSLLLIGGPDANRVAAKPAGDVDVRAHGRRHRAAKFAAAFSRGIIRWLNIHEIPPR